MKIVVLTLALFLLREATTELATRLYTRFHATPTTQAQKDENQLIDYAVEKNLDVKRTASGLYYLIHKEGTGPNLVHGQPTKAHYQGYTLDGKIFDTSHKRGKPLSFAVGEMIAGWNEALKYPGLIPPNAPLVFDLEVMPLVQD